MDKFRPLRVDRKTGKSIVASYGQWRRIFAAHATDSPTSLYVDASYKSMDRNDRVYNHAGKNLFWRECGGFDTDLDRDGVPIFSCITADHLFNSGTDMTHYEPLTVSIVGFWIEWFLSYQLRNIIIHHNEDYQSTC